MLGGAALALAGAATAFRASRFIAGAVVADGAVTRLNAGGSHPQIAFRTRDGATVSYPQGGMIAGFRVGQAVRVYYDPADPSGSAMVRSFGSVWGSSLALAICGAGLLAAGLASIRLPVGFHLGGR